MIKIANFRLLLVFCEYFADILQIDKQKRLKRIN